MTNKDSLLQIISCDLICMEKVSMRLVMVALVLVGIVLAASQEVVDASTCVATDSPELAEERKKLEKLTAIFSRPRGVCHASEGCRDEPLLIDD
ncbi:hypothetical protein DAI22_08g205200 [Oryza sativa Japonica Group]|nr:hypothetical protein DAI22_08g205200 [Oryza sativa Japonica Group]